MDYFRIVAGTACANPVKCGKAVPREGSPRTLAGWRGDGGGRRDPAGGHLSDHSGPSQHCLAVWGFLRKAREGCGQVFRRPGT